MPSKKKKYNARFPAGRIKKIMQTDKEVGKVAQAVPVIISRTLELFVESLLTKSIQITQMRNAKTLTPYHMKQCILSESRFDFLKDLVKYIPDVSTQDENESNSLEASEFNSIHEDEEEPVKQEPNLGGQGTSAGRTPVIQYMPKLIKQESNQEQNLITPAVIPSLVPIEGQEIPPSPTPVPVVDETKLPPLVPLANNNRQNSSDMFLIDEDYDN